MRLIYNPEIDYCGRCRHWTKIGSINGLFGRCGNQNSQKYGKELYYEASCKMYQAR